jgi:hypothetical protein
MIKSSITITLMIIMMMMIRIIPTPIENGDDKCDDMKDPMAKIREMRFFFQMVSLLIGSNIKWGYLTDTRKSRTCKLKDNDFICVEKIIDRNRLARMVHLAFR